MAECISVLGSTGSIGIQTLEVARNLNLRVCALTANRNIDLLEKQAREFSPRMVAVADSELAEELRGRLSDTSVSVYEGTDGIRKAASMESADTVVVALVGIAGLIPTLEAIRSSKNIALANKEVLVTAGHLVMAEAKKYGVSILPVDSEHSAIFQCIAGNDSKGIEKIILTASGGPFRGKTRDELKNVSLEDALAHPNWNMGKKITIDSATLMNKGLEVIEARWLFNVEPERIQVLVHPQSIIHSMVEYVDGSIIAQLGPPDMRIPIQYALTYPQRKGNSFKRAFFPECGALTFENPDFESFPCLRLAFDAVKAGGTMPVVLNGANEVAVGMFLKGRIGFTDIPEIIERTMKLHSTNTTPCLDDIIEVDKWARQAAEEIALKG